MLIKVGAVAVAAYVAYTQGWLSSLGIGTPASTGAPVASATPAAASVPATPTPDQSAASVASNASAQGLDAIYTAMLKLATDAGTTSTGVDGWGYYLTDAVPGMVAPDPIADLSAAAPNFDRSQNFSASQYWAMMGPALGAKLGLHGLGLGPSGSRHGWYA